MNYLLSNLLNNVNSAIIVTIFINSYELIMSILSKKLLEKNFVVNFVIITNISKKFKINKYSSPGSVNITYLDINQTEKINEIISISSYIISMLNGISDDLISNSQYINAQIPEKIASISQKFENVKLFIYLSNLNIETGNSLFSKTKLIGENAVLSAFNRAIILRSGIVFTENDPLINIISLFIKKFKFLPIFTSQKHKIKIQPLSGGDFIYSIIFLLTDDNLNINESKIYKIAGSEVFDLEEFYDKVLKSEDFNIKYKKININIFKKILKIIKFPLFSIFNKLLFNSSSIPFNIEEMNLIEMNQVIMKKEQNLLYNLNKEPESIDAIFNRCNLLNH